MHLPSALDARESILCLYRTKAERMHAVLHFLLSGFERDERLVTVLDEASEGRARGLLVDLGLDGDGNRYRSLAAESFAVHGPVDPDGVIDRIRRTASAWRGRPSHRPVRIVVDLYFVLAALASGRDVIELSARIAELTAELPVICLYLLFVEQIPRRGLQTFLRSFSRIVPAESLVSGSGDGPIGDPRDRSGELDAVLDRLLLSDERVMEKAVNGADGRLADLDARAFLHIAGDGILILDESLAVQYASPSLTAQIRGGQRFRQNTPLAALFSSRAYASVEAAFAKLAADSSGVRTPVAGIVTLPFSTASGENVFEASVTPITAYGRALGFVCVLRGVIDEASAGGAWAPVQQGGAPARRLSDPGPGRSATGMQVWRVLPRTVIEGRSLSERETEILEHTLNGRSSDEIADRLTIAVVTVKKHRSNAYRKLGIHDRFELYRLADTAR